jgi:hypothetical protein
LRALTNRQAIPLAAGGLSAQVDALIEEIARDSARHAALEIA